MNPWLIAALAGGGALKTLLADMPEYKRNALLQSQLERTSWATGRHGQLPNKPNMWNAMLGGGMAGVGLSQNQQALDNAKNVSVNLAQGGGNPWAMQSPQTMDPAQFWAQPTIQGGTGNKYSVFGGA